MDHQCRDYGWGDCVNEYFFEFKEKEYAGTFKTGQKEEEGNEDTELEGKFISRACLLFQHCYLSIEPIETIDDIDQDPLWFCQQPQTRRGS